MVELMPFGKYKGQSVEQIALRDYRYFAEFMVDELLLRNKIKSHRLEERVEKVEYALNYFKPVLPCGYKGCESGKPPRKISIYNGYRGIRTSSTDFIYCSDRCYDKDPKVTVESHKPSLQSLAFRTAISSTKFDTEQLVKVMCDCMGMKEGRKTKEYLENFIDEIDYF